MKTEEILWESEKNIHLRYALGLNGGLLHNGDTVIVDSVVRALSGTGNRIFDVSFSYLMKDAAGIRLTIKYWERAMRRG